LVVVLREARVLKQLVPLDNAFAQAELSVLAARLNEQVSGKTVSELRDVPPAIDATEQRLIGTIEHLLTDEASRDVAIRVEGVAGMLAQPEFREDHQGALNIVSLVDRHTPERVVPEGSLGGDGVSVVIGGENPADALHHCSVVVAPYGDRSGLSGYVALVGPTRMQYGRGVATVRYLRDLLEEMMDRVYG
jgi:heat-inducible transcriptional repressor